MKRRQLLFKKFLSIFATFALFIFFYIPLAGCHNGSEDQLEETADSFAEAYFNWQFAKAVPHVTDSSVIWLQYASSQVDQEDIDSLRAMSEGATCELSDVDYGDDDTTAVVTMQVKHFLAMDSIGTSRHVVEAGVFALPMVYQNEKWKVSLRALPRWKHVKDD